MIPTKPLFVWHNKTFVRLDPFDITVIATEGNYTRIFAVDNKCYFLRTTLGALMERLPSGIFLQTHRSYAVSMFYIDSITREEVSVGTTSIPIAKQYHDDFLKQLQLID